MSVIKMVSSYPKFAKEAFSGWIEEKKEAQKTKKKEHGAMLTFIIEVQF